MAGKSGLPSYRTRRQARHCSEGFRIYSKDRNERVVEVGH
jgi:hypothetical protein